MRTPLVIGNWKMNGSREQIQGLLDGVLRGLQPAECHAGIGICPPSIYIPLVSEILANTIVRTGVQNISAFVEGAYTGETSARMAADFGCAYALVGHSERRTLFGETDADVVAKVRQAFAAGLVPVICVGETLSQREAGKTIEIVSRQVNAVLDAYAPAELGGVVFAYEPVWAIGTGQTATPDQAQSVHELIRRLLGGKSGAIAASIRILYGGSVKADNAALLFGQPDIDGGLIGGASLDAAQFCAIIQAAN